MPSVREAKTVVVISMLATGAVVSINRLRQGEAPKPRSLLGLGVAYVILAGLADTEPALAAPLSALLATGAVLTDGPGIFTAITHAEKSKKPLGLPPKPGTVTGIGLPSILGGGQPSIFPYNVSAKAARAVKIAEAQVGLPYVYGGESHATGFDCSGLCQFAYRLAGVNIPRTSEAQAAAGFPAVDQGNIAPGDLVFSQWPGDPQPSPGHVVIAVGQNRVVAAPHPGVTVQYEPLSTFFGPVYRGAVRPAP